MTHFSNRIGSVYGLSLVVALGAVLGCSSDDSGGAKGGDTQAVACTKTDLPLYFSPMYSAYDGKHTFQIPAIVNGVSGARITWTASDKSMVAIDADDKTGGVMITTLKAGTVTITAQVEDHCGSAPLTIAAVTEADWQAGSDRYNNGNPLPDLMLTGTPMLPPPGVNPLEVPGKPPACTNCHGDLSTGGIFKSVQHTPQQTGGFSDEELTAVFLQGIIPEGGYFDSSIIPQNIWKFFHMWNDVTPEQAKGIVVYLRSLTPKTQGGKFDFTGITAGGTGGAAATGAGGAAATGAGGAAAAAGGAAAAAGGAAP